MFIKCMMHDDVIKWKHFPRYWPFVRGIHRTPVNSLHKGQLRGALTFSLICTWINNREAGDFRRHRARYDVTVMARKKISLHSSKEFSMTHSAFIRLGILGWIDSTSHVILRKTFAREKYNTDNRGYCWRSIKHVYWMQVHWKMQRPCVYKILQNNRLAKQPSKSGHGCIITFHNIVWIFL